MPARELFKSREITEAYGGKKGTRIFEVVWADRYSEAPQLGDSWPDDYSLHVTERQFKPITKAAGIHSTDYGYGIVTVTYSSRDRQQLEESMEVQNAAEPVEADFLYFLEKDGSKTFLSEKAQFVYLLQPRVGYSFAVTKTYNPVRALLDIVGKVNKGNFRGYPAETLLYESSNISKSWNSAGKEFYTITHHLLYNKNGWNFQRRLSDPTLPGEPYFWFQRVYPGLYYTDSFAVLT